MKPATKEKYDATYQYGGTTVHIVAPKLTDEEREQRLAEIQSIIWNLWEQNQTKVSNPHR